MKNKYKFIIITFFLFLFVLLLLNFRNYSITEIDADNFDNILVSEKKSISFTHINRYIPDNYSLFSINPNLVFNSKPEITKYDDGEIRTGIYIKESKNQYSTNFIYGNPYLVSIGSDANTIRNIVDQLILKEGFSLKKTIFINHSDIIIKELEDRFIIGVLYMHYDGSDLNGINLISYSKNRFSHYFK
jgi:hypothetical protein